MRVRIVPYQPRWYSKYICRWRRHKLRRTGYQSRFYNGLMQMQCIRCAELFVVHPKAMFLFPWTELWTEIASGDWESVAVDGPFIDHRPFDPGIADIFRDY